MKGFPANGMGEKVLSPNNFAMMALLGKMSFSGKWSIYIHSMCAGAIASHIDLHIVKILLPKKSVKTLFIALFPCKGGKV